MMVGLIALLATGCLEERMKKAQEKVEWKTMDSVFQYMIPQPGKVKFAKGDPIAVEIKAVLGNNGTKMIDTASVNKGCLQFAYSVASKMIHANEKGIIKRSEEGILRADFSVIDFRSDFVVMVYLNKIVTQNEADTLIKYLRRSPEVQSATFISQEEAKKRWLAAGEDDFSKFLDENPLPASIELKIEPDYLTETAIKEFTVGMQEKYSIQINSVRYNADFALGIDCLRKYIFLISYKT
jgi:hypothetical protein